MMFHDDWMRRQDTTHGLDAGQHADVSCKVGGLEDGLVVSPEVEVDHEGLQLLANDP